MYIRKRIKKRSFLKKHRFLMLFLVGVASCLFAFILANKIRNAAEIMPPVQPIQGNSPVAMGVAQLARHERVVYPYSVISGGVRSREELDAQIANDRVVADHYRDFNIQKTRIVRAEENRMMYVSYRLKNKVYWTAKKVEIPKGESLITDGDCEARTRCGNRLAAARQQPVSEEEPGIESFEMPQIASSDLPALDPVPVAALEFDPIPMAGLEIDPIPPLPAFVPLASDLRPAILPYYYRPLFVVRPLEPVPEAGTLTLLFTGLAALFATRWVRKK